MHEPARVEFCRQEEGERAGKREEEREKKGRRRKEEKSKKEKEKQKQKKKRKEKRGKEIELPTHKTFLRQFHWNKNPLYKKKTPKTKGKTVAPSQEMVSGTLALPIDIVGTVYK